MKTVQLKELKEDLSSLAEEASHGAEIMVTKHQRPYIRLVPGDAPHLYRGRLVGRENLTPAFREATQGRWLDILEEDRSEK
ncbi:MAG: type II toxin-antitoxin system prevent-host-death family antitoxin [Deltaproteobacteria bacterium]|nr:type II toxin-antitoxin system prevent-host-death family antitoxin [Deltaproteobacteria bacterium]